MPGVDEAITPSSTYTSSFRLVPNRGERGIHSLRIRTTAGALRSETDIAALVPSPFFWRRPAKTPIRALAKLGKDFDGEALTEFARSSALHPTRRFLE
jgi:hypothetical protein